MKKYVEVYRPTVKTRLKLKYRVHSERDYSTDVLSPSMTAVFEVDHVRTNEEAVACVIEKLAGFNTAVRLIRGGK